MAWSLRLLTQQIFSQEHSEHLHNAMVIHIVTQYVEFCDFSSQIQPNNWKFYLTANGQCSACECCVAQATRTLQANFHAMLTFMSFVASLESTAAIGVPSER